MSVQVSFVLEVGEPPEHYDEARLSAPEMETGLFTDQDAYGRVVIDGEGVAGFEVEDSLDNLVPELCLRAIPPLVAGERVDIALEAYYGRLTLAPDGEQIRVETSKAQGPSYPAAALLRALLGCGQRYAALARQMVAAGGYAVHSLDELDADQAAAEAALSGSR